MTNSWAQSTAAQDKTVPQLDAQCKQRSCERAMQSFLRVGSNAEVKKRMKYIFKMPMLRNVEQI